MNEECKNFLYELKGALWALSGVASGGQSVNPLSQPLADYAEMLSERLAKLEERK